jgi:hypothetical protein
VTDPPPPPGLQAERTELAWVRTALSGTGLALVAGRVGPAPVSLQVTLAIGVAVMVLGLAACLLRTRSLSSRTEPVAASTVSVALLAASVTVAEVIALALVVR